MTMTQKLDSSLIFDLATRAEPYTCGMPRKLTSRAAIRRTVAKNPYSFQGSGSPGSGSTPQGHWARRCGLMEPVATQKATIQTGAATHRTACLAAGPQMEEEEGMAVALLWTVVPNGC